MSDCKVLIRRAADLWWKLAASESHLEGGIRQPLGYILFLNSCVSSLPLRGFNGTREKGGNTFNK